MKKQKSIIILLFVTVLCSAVFLGCNAGRLIVPEEYEAAGLQKVSMYYNGGTEGSNLSVEYFIPKGGRMPLPSSSQESYLSVPSRSGYELYTWLQLDDVDMLKERAELVPNTLNTKNQPASRLVPYIEGHDFTNPDKNEQSLTYKDFEDERVDGYTGEKIFAREWNFDFDKVTEDICLVAIWRPMRYYVILPFENINDDIDEIGYNKQKLRSIDATGAIVRPANSQMPTKTGSQVEGLFLDTNFTIPVPFDKNNKYYPPAELMTSGDRYKVVPLYAKWLDAKYKIVSTASDINDIKTDENYYITRDLDFEGVTMRVPSVYSGEIEGNGFTWKNLTINIKQTNPLAQGPDNYGAIFNELLEAHIYRINFENLNIVFERLNPSEENINWSRPVNIHVFARKMDTRTEIRDVTLGSESNPVRCTMVEATAFGTFNQLPELKNGYLQYSTMYHGWVPADEHGVYPVENQIATINGVTEEVIYMKNYLGEIVTKRTPLLDDDDSKPLYGYRKFAPPTNLQDPPEVPTFMEEIFGNVAYPRVSGCTLEMQVQDADFEWEKVYGPDKDAPGALPNIAGTSLTYIFAGWYKEVTRTVSEGGAPAVSYKAFEKYDFTQSPTGDDTLIALWKLS